MKVKKEKVFLIVLLILSFLRFFYKIQERAMFEYDQEFLILEAKKIIIDKKITLIGAPTSIGGMFIAPLYSYLVALLMFLAKMNPYALSYLTAFWGAVTILIIYLICLDLFGFRPAFFASLTAVFSFFFLDAFPPLVQPLALVSLLIFWSLLKATKGRRYFFLAAFLTGVTFNLHFSAIFFPVLIFLYSLWNKIKIKPSQILMMLLTLMLFLSPMFLFEIRHNFFMTKNFLDFFQKNTPLEKNVGLDMNLWENFGRVLKINLEHLASLVFLNNLLIQISLVLIILTFTARFLWLKDKKIFKAFFLWLLVPIFLFSVYRGHIIPYYFLLQEVVLFLAAGLFFSFLWKKKSLRIFVAFFFLIFIQKNYFQWFNWKTLRSLNYKIMVLEYIKKRSQNQPIYLSHTMEQGTGYGFDYLEWYLKINKKEDKNLPIYTIVAPFNWHDIKTHFHFEDYGVVLPELK